MQPSRQLPRRRQLDDLDAGDVFMRGDFGQRRGRRQCVKIKNADCMSAGASAADRHLGNIDAVIAKDCAHSANDAWHVVVRENEQVAIEIGFEAEFAEANQPWRCDSNCSAPGLPE